MSGGTTGGPFPRLESRYIALPAADVDTDQIIPARFLTVTDRAGVGDGLFADWRRHDDGTDRRDFPLNRPEASGAEVLVTGDNFGCGSSREHAAWALLENGFRAVVSTGLADIFRANALKNGLLPVEIDAELHRRLLAAGSGEIVVDLQEQTVVASDGARAGFSVDPFARHCLLEGIDELGFLTRHEDAIASFEAGRRSSPPAVTPRDDTSP